MEKTTHLTASAVLGHTPYRTQVSLRGHTLVADEPLDKGGQDEGPRPHELLCASLASCTLITVRMYADRKGWALRSLSVEVELDRTALQASIDTRIRMRLRAEGDLDDSQRARLVQIAQLCPVHKTLQHPIHIETTLAA
ncbi:MAG: OsmC family protein [Flavobacteriales bacterium]|nr:OsmC family protein [Flavobacteriales bacterium]MBK6752341.1 OsmC family protein [Flavobacteriales bacterium]MBK7084678.1 OsmC family protein [Flavobacteriales bacterium]MBK7752203.1 OsmC family protein [Flavobacteriales bacterium]MBK9074313.1 OsmC family protein [Flavobacteriales bacterium]